MDFISPALIECVIGRLASAGVIPDGFNKKCDDPFCVALLSSSDLHGNMRTVMLFHLK